MINVFNSPIEASTLDEFHAEGQSEERQSSIFENTRKRPVVSYDDNGRKLVNGKVADESSPNAMWATAITRGVANEWREKAEGSRLVRARKYVSNLGYDCRVFVYQQSHKHATPLLLLLNVSLVVIALHLFKVYIW